MSNILYTGDRGFIAGYAIEELLKYGHVVVGIDNLSKYGKVDKSYDNNENYVHIDGDVRNTELLNSLIQNYSIDQIVAGAAQIGGISFFHQIPYDILKENEEITIAVFEAAIKNKVEKINVLSSSMVFERAKLFPTAEREIDAVIVPLSSYGFQKLATEYFAKSAFEQYGLKYTIIRPFNAVGVGEYRAKLESETMSGNIKLSMSHVVPDLVQKVLKGQFPVRIFGDGHQIRCYTYGGDIARGIRLCIENEMSVCEDFNISTPTQTSVMELLLMIWGIINLDKELKVEFDVPFKNDVQYRVPDVSKAKTVLGFEANTDLEEILENEVIPWVRDAINNNLI